GEFPAAQPAVAVVVGDMELGSQLVVHARLFAADEAVRVHVQRIEVDPVFASDRIGFMAADGDVLALRAAADDVTGDGVGVDRGVAGRNGRGRNLGGRVLALLGR